MGEFENQIRKIIGEKHVTTIMETFKNCQINSREWLIQ